MLESPRERMILKACLERRPDAWEEFLEEYLPTIHHVVSRVGKQLQVNTTDLRKAQEDIVAGVLASLLRRDMAELRNYRGESNFGTYLGVISKRLACELWLPLVESGANSISQDESLSSSHEEMGADEDAPSDEVERMLHDLKPLEREAVRLHHLEGCSHEDVARQLKIPLQSVAKVLGRARRKIQAGNRDLQRE
jgi:RNA polymerase sigma-70 factor (ECF subfamily)